MTAIQIEFFMDNINMIAGSFGRDGASYRGFCARYSDNLSKDFEEEAARYGFSNGKEALRSNPRIYINGSFIQAKLSAETAEVDKAIGDSKINAAKKRKEEADRRARFERMDAQRSTDKPKRKAKKSLLRYVSTVSVTADSNYAHQNVSKTRYDPYASDDDCYSNAPSQSRNFQQNDQWQDDQWQDDTYQNGSANGYRDENNKVNDNYRQQEYSPAPQPDQQHSPEVEPPKQQITPFVREEITSIDCKAIMNGNTPLFTCSLDDTIASAAKKVSNLVGTAVNYGQEDVLPLKLIKNFIEENELSEQVRLKQFASLASLFSNWNVAIDGMKAVFSLARNQPGTVYDLYWNHIAGEPTNVNIGSEGVGKIIGTTKDKELVVRLDRLEPECTKLKRDLRNYYTFFTMRPRTDLARPMTEIFVQDFALYHDQRNSRFLRCIVDKILAPGNVTIFCIDEGSSIMTYPELLYPMPLKFRVFEPMCLTFSMCLKDGGEISEDQKASLMNKMEGLIQNEVKCRFLFIRNEKRNNLPDLFFGPWRPVNIPSS